MSQPASKGGTPLGAPGVPPPVSQPVEPGLQFFSGPNPIGGPVGEGYRGVSAVRLPFYESIFRSSGPIGVFAVSIAGDPVDRPPGRGGEPIERIGLVLPDGFPIGGPVTQIFRGGSAPVVPTLYYSALRPSGPIGPFFVGLEGAPIGVATMGGGGLPIEAPEALARVEARLQPRTAMVGATPVTSILPPAVAFAG